MSERTDTNTRSPDGTASSSRLQRNLAEKHRRDKLNGYINELATIVPMVSMATKRLDKTSVLRLSAAHLRLHHSSLSIHRKSTSKKNIWRPSFFTTDHLSDLLEAVDGFLLVTTCSGKIIYISQFVEQFLGYQHVEMIGHSLFSYIHPADVDHICNHFSSIAEAASTEKNGFRSGNRYSLFCRMRERCQPRSEVVTYRLMHIVGQISGLKDNAKYNEEDPDDKANVLQTNILLKAFVRVVHSNLFSEVSLNNSTQDEYVTRHSSNGIIIFADHRLSTITGHLPHEVCGLSAYDYIKQEDIPMALFAHKLMFTNSNGTGTIVYRLRTRNEDFVYLKSIGHLQYDKTSTQVEYFMCINRLLGNEEGKAELKKFMNNFTPHISENSSAFLESISHTSNLSMSSSKPLKFGKDTTISTSFDQNLLNHLCEVKNQTQQAKASESVDVLMDDINKSVNVGKTQNIGQTYSLETDLSKCNKNNDTKINTSIACSTTNVKYTHTSESEQKQQLKMDSLVYANAGNSSSIDELRLIYKKKLTVECNSIPHEQNQNPTTPSVKKSSIPKVHNDCVKSSLNVSFEPTDDYSSCIDDLPNHLLPSSFNNIHSDAEYQNCSLFSSKESGEPQLAVNNSLNSCSLLSEVISYPLPHSTALSNTLPTSKQNEQGMCVNQFLENINRCTDSILTDDLNAQNGNLEPPSESSSLEVWLQMFANGIPSFPKMQMSNGCEEHDNIIANNHKKVHSANHCSPSSERLLNDEHMTEEQCGRFRNDKDICMDEQDCTPAHFFHKLRDRHHSVDLRLKSQQWELNGLQSSLTQCPIGFGKEAYQRQIIDLKEQVNAQTQDLARLQGEFRINEGSTFSSYSMNRQAYFHPDSFRNMNSSP